MKDVQHPCHLLPKAERCDHRGLGDFMGHTCQLRAEEILRRALRRRAPTAPKRGKGRKK